MKLGIISDTHDRIEESRQAIKVFNDAKVDQVVHLGDWVSPFILKVYKELNAPIKSVFGNNEGDTFRHLEFVKEEKMNVEYHDSFLALEVDGKKIAAYHGDAPEMVEALIKCGDWDIVLSGHNHTAKIEKVGDVLAINPGTLVRGSNEFNPKANVDPSIAILDCESMEARIIELNKLK